MTTASYDANTGTGAISMQGVTVTSDGTVDISGLVDSVMLKLDANAPKFLQQMMNAAASFAATDAAIEGAIATAVAVLPSEIGAGVSAVAGPFAPVAAAVFLIVDFLISGNSALSGTGCCGTAPLSPVDITSAYIVEKTLDPNAPPPQMQNLMRYSGQNATAAPCDPSKFSWQAVWGSYTDAPGAERFINTTIRTAFEQAEGCWNTMTPPEYIVSLAAAVGIWNRTHGSQRTIAGPGGKPVTLGPTTIFRMVNVTEQKTFGSGTTSEPGQPEDNSPLSVALNMAAQRWSCTKSNGYKGQFMVPVGHLASVVVNEGPEIKPGTISAAVGSLKRLVTGPESPKPSPPPTAPTLTTKAQAEAQLASIFSAPTKAQAQASAPIIPWEDQKVTWLAGATPKQAGVAVGAASVLAWVLRALRA